MLKSRLRTPNSDHLARRIGYWFRALAATVVAGLATGLTRALLWSGGRLLRWADALMLQSARWQDQLLPPSMLQAQDRPAASSRSRGR
ncbi:MAG: hypothetical protein ACODAQ_11370 [Phycisphaeraceae bacterium]